MAPESVLRRLEAEFDNSPESIQAVVALLERGAPPQFIARYRRDETGDPGEERLAAIEERWHFLQDLEARKQAILEQAEQRGAVTDALRETLSATHDQDLLDDIYQSFRPRRRTAGMQAADRGVGPLAEAVHHRQLGERTLQEVAQDYVNAENELPTIEAVLEGVLYILAERYAGDPELRADLRNELSRGVLKATVAAPDRKGANRYQDFFAFEEPVRRISASRMLALRRAEREGIISVHLSLPENREVEIFRARFAADLSPDAPLLAYLDLVFQHAYDQHVRPACEADIRRKIKEKADRETLRTFGRSLRSQLLSPPLGPKKVMVLRASSRTVWAVLLAEDGSVAAQRTLHLWDPEAEAKRAAKEQRKAEASAAKASEPTPVSDAGPTPDTATPDTAAPDTAAPDTAAPDTAAPDTTAPDTAAPESAAPDAAVPEGDASTTAADPAPSAEAAPSEVAPPTAEAAPPTAEVAPPTVEAAPPTAEVAAPAAAEAAPAEPPAGEPPAGEPPAGEPPAGEPPAVEPSTAAPTAAEAPAPPAPDVPAPPPEASATTEADATPAAGEPGTETAEPSQPLRGSAVENCSRDEAVTILVELLRAERPAALAIPHGRRQEMSLKMSRAVLEKFDGEVMLLPVDEAVSAIYATSSSGRKAMPHVEVGIRTAINLGRRLQDPMLELLAMDPRDLGLGQSLNEVHQGMLKRHLDQVVGSCLALVGVDLSRASTDLLARLPGVSRDLAKAIVDHRKAQGSLQNLEQLRAVAGVDDDTFTHVTGFLRVVGGDQVLDASSAHPENYPLAEKIAAQQGKPLAELLGHEVRGVDLAALAQEGHGRLRTLDLLDAIAAHGRDPRGRLTVWTNAGVTSPDDLKPDQQLRGRVTNVTEFGAFVDLGVGHDGLVHISQIPGRRMNNPDQALRVGEVITVYVQRVEQGGKRISLTMHQPRHLAEGRSATVGERMGGRGRRQGRGRGPQREGERVMTRAARAPDGRRGDRRGAPRRGAAAQGGGGFGGGFGGGRGRGHDRDRGPRGEPRVITVESEKHIEESRGHKGELRSLAGLRALLGGSGEKDGGESSGS